MPLKLYPRPNGIFHIRGTVQGQRIDESSRTRVRAEAEAIRAQLEADLFKRAIYGAKSVVTFAELATIYMEAGKPNDHLADIIAEIGLMKGSDIDQSIVDALAKKLKPGCSPATLIRQVYTPVSAVMNFSAPKLCDPISFAKPKSASARIDFMTPGQVETLLGFLPDHLRRLVIFLVATGCRISEALNLQWRDVSPDLHRVVLWETKGGYSRGVDLQRRAQEALPARSDNENDFVWLNSDGEPWSAHDGVNSSLKKHCERHKPDGTLIPFKERATYEGPRFRPVHNHLFRHTWATWAYAVTHDLTFMMSQGGWKSVELVMRYSHTASPDLAKAVRKHGWEIRAKRA